MSNKRYNCNKKVKKPFHEFQYSAGEYCNLLLDDCFNYAEGKYGEIRIIKGFDKPAEMNIDKLSLFLTSCIIEWDRYCYGHSLPGESRKLFESRLIKQWVDMGKGKQVLDALSRNNAN